MEIVLRIDKQIFRQESAAVDAQITEGRDLERLERYWERLTAIMMVVEVFEAGGSSIDAIRVLQGTPFVPQTQEVHFGDQIVRLPLTRSRRSTRVTVPPPNLATKARIRAMDERGV